MATPFLFQRISVVFLSISYSFFRYIELDTNQKMLFLPNDEEKRDICIDLIYVFVLCVLCALEYRLSGSRRTCIYN